MWLAQNLARNCGYAVFPVLESKMPALKRWPQRATTDLDQIARLWSEHSAPLIGIVCGEQSGISVLDLDAKHDEARAWYYQNWDIPATRCFKTRLGGSHCYFQHAPGVRNSAGKIAPGIDVRGSGGYVVSWWCAGLPCVNHSPVAPWPGWLLRLILPPPAKLLPGRPHGGTRNGDASIAGILKTVAGAPEGQRNQRLHWSACRLADRVRAGQLRRIVAEALLAEAARAIGLPHAESLATIRSGLNAVGT
jgi:hypothetical protein